MLRFYSTILILFALLILPAISTAEIELIYDDWGTPHVFADSDEGAFYGLGWAAARDRGFQMHYSLRTIQGRLAELFGPERENRKYTTVEFDRKMRTLGFYRAAQRVAGNLDAESIALLQAYSDGVNDYFAEHQDDLSPLFEGLGLEPETWTPADSIACWWNIGRFFATEGLNDAMQYYCAMEGSRNSIGRGGRARGMSREQVEELEARMKNAQRVYDDEAAVIQREDVSQEWIDEVNAFLAEHGFSPDAERKEESPKFSHAWVVGGDLSTTGAAVLCSDPQTPVRNPSLFYEFHVSGETFNARGMGVPGSPIILIGWNQRVAWGLTALGADQADQFKLVTDPDKPNQYLFDGEWREMDLIEEVIQVKGEDPATMTVRETRFGPVVNEFAPAVREDDVFAMKRVPVCDDDRETIQGAIAMMRSANVDEFFTALEGWRFPSANVVFGDADGGIGYSLAAAIPLRSPHAVDGGAVAHDGSESKFDWQGFVPQRLLPHVFNPERGYLHSGNHRPIASFYPAPMGLSTGAGGDTVRSWRLRERLEADNSFTPEEVLDIHYDSVNAAKRVILRAGYHIRETYREALSEDALKALEHLEAWYENGAKADWRVEGNALASNINTMFRIITTPLAGVYGGGQSGLSFFLKTLDWKLDQAPDATIDDKDEIDFIDQTLANAWRATAGRSRSESGQWNRAGWRAMQQQRLGYFDTLDGFGSLDREHDLNPPALRNTDGETIFSQMAQSYTQWVPLHDVDSARSLMPIGNSERIDSAYRSANVENWESGEMRSAPLSRKAVDAIASERMTLER